MSYRFYRSPVIQGPTGPSGNPTFRNKLADYIPSVTDPTSSYHDVGNLARPLFYSLANADAATHTLISLDSEITAIGPEHDDLSALNTWLNEAILPIPAALSALLEGDGFSVSWLTEGHTRRDAFRYAFRVWRCQQDAKGKDSQFTGAIKLFNLALADKISDLTQAQRIAVRDWIEAKGIDISTITNSTTIRTAIHFLLSNWSCIAHPLGEVSF